MSVVGVKLDQFDDPVCNSFQAKILNDQLCYEVDLNRFCNKSNIAKESLAEESKMGMGANLLESDKIEHAFIYLDTIGKERLKNTPKNSLYLFCSCYYRAS